MSTWYVHSEHMNIQYYSNNTLKLDKGRRPIEASSRDGTEVMHLSSTNKCASTATCLAKTVATSSFQPYRQIPEKMIYKLNHQQTLMKIWLYYSTQQTGLG